jgi:hypothetical protein
MKISCCSHNIRVTALELSSYVRRLSILQDKLHKFIAESNWQTFAIYEQIHEKKKLFESINRFPTITNRPETAGKVNISPESDEVRTTRRQTY